MNFERFKLEKPIHYNNDGFRLDTSQIEFNTIVKCSTIQIFKTNLEDWEVTGRLVQVRKKMAVDGSDLFFIRRCDNSLYSFYNEAVYILTEEGVNYVSEFFQVNGDKPNKVYSINYKKKKQGFIVSK